MAENINKYQAGKALLQLLQQHGLKPVAVQQVTETVAQLLEEAGLVTQAPSGQKQAPQLQQQQQAPSTRDLESADAVLRGLSFNIPRGRFDCGFYKDCMQITNKQTCADIPYSSIQHVLIIDAVPKQPDTTFLVLVMKSGQPVRQGKNSLDLVVLQTKDQPELSLLAPEACSHLGDTLCGAAAVVLSQLLASYIEGITDDTFLTADSSVFSSSAGDLMVSANRGAQPGWLVPLSAGLCYLGKQGCFMPLPAISRLLFHRTGGGSSTFDITIKLAGGAKPLELGQIDAAELPKLQTYCLNQRIQMGGDDDDSEDEGAPAAAGPGAAAAKGAAAAAAGAGSDDDEEDEDFDPDAAGTGGQQRDRKRRRLSAPGAAAAAGGVEEGSGTDDEEDEEEDGSEGSDDDEGSSSDPELVATDELSGMEEDEGY